MKKTAFVLVCLGLIVAGILVSGCSAKSKSPTINYQRRLQNYLPANSTSNQNYNGTIDLSEGPKLEYNRHLGPNDLNFDIKIKNPY